MSSLSITVPAFVTVTVPCTTVSFVPGGTPVFVGPGLPGGSGTVGDGVGFGFGFGFGVGVAVGVGFGCGVGLTVGFGVVVGLACNGEADDDEPAVGVAYVDSGPAHDGGAEEAGAAEPGALEVDDGVLGSAEAGADELTGGADAAVFTFVAGERSMTAATMRPPSSTSTSVTTMTRSRTEPGICMAVRSP
jgi:hypothetical protein